MSFTIVCQRTTSSFRLTTTTSSCPVLCSVLIGWHHGSCPTRWENGEKTKSDTLINFFFILSGHSETSRACSPLGHTTWGRAVVTPTPQNLSVASGRYQADIVKSDPGTKHCLLPIGCRHTTRGLCPRMQQTGSVRLSSSVLGRFLAPISRKHPFLLLGRSSAAASETHNSQPPVSFSVCQIDFWVRSDIGGPPSRAASRPDRLQKSAHTHAQLATHTHTHTHTHTLTLTESLSASWWRIFYGSFVWVSEQLNARETER